MIVRPGSGNDPVGQYDRVSVQYSTWTQDGRLFYSTRTRKAPTSFELQQVSPGLREGIIGMRKGEIRRLWIPAKLAKTNRKSPQGPVLTEVELLGLGKGRPPVPAPADVAAAPANATGMADGVRYTVLSPPTGEYNPARHDRITMVLTSWDPSGKMLDTSERHGGSDTMVTGQAPPGVAEALLQMRSGEKRRLWVPLEVVRRRPSQTTTPVVYDVELLKFVDMPDPPDAPKHLTPPKTGVKRTKSGLVYKILKPGRGKVSPEDPKKKVSMHLSGWTTDGQLITSTIMNDRPYRVRLRSALPAFQEMLKMMVVGEKRRIWIPAELAFKGKPSRPQGDVVYDLELLIIH